MALAVAVTVGVSLGEGERERVTVRDCVNVGVPEEDGERLGVTDTVGDGVCCASARHVTQQQSNARRGIRILRRREGRGRRAVMRIGVLRAGGRGTRRWRQGQRAQGSARDEKSCVTDPDSAKQQNKLEILFTLGPCAQGPRP